MTAPLFHSAEQAVSVLWFAAARLSAIINWLIIGLLHVVLGLLLVLWAWWSHWTPELVQSTFLQSAQSTTAAALGVVGLSGATALALWVWLMRRLHRWLGHLTSAWILPKPE